MMPMYMIRRTASTSSLTVSSNFNFVPKHEAAKERDVQTLQSFVSQNSKLLIITGAGVSTESGIPDYRSEGVGLYATSNHRPMKIQEFLSSPTARQRYWARNYLGWPKFASLKPNLGHLTIRDWEIGGKVKCLVTQNVDGLHKKAGSEDSIELHGTGHLVLCLSCNYSVDRAIFQNVLFDVNCHLGDGTIRGQEESAIRPDGDVHLNPEVSERFVIPPCPSCGGVLKPDIVFFGDNVPKSRVQNIYDELEGCEGCVVLGSSLQTFSAFRYIIKSKEMGLPILIVNLGPTRADSIVNHKIMCRVGQILPLISF